MGKATGFMDYKREKPNERDPLTRQNDWKEYSAPYTDEVLKQQGARCMDCGTPFCQIGMEIRGGVSGCPIYNLIPEWNDLVYRGRWKEALERLQKRTISLNLLEEYVQHLVKAHVPSRSMIQQYRLKISNGRSLIKVLKMAGLHQEFLQAVQGKRSPLSDQDQQDWQVQTN